MHLKHELQSIISGIGRNSKTNLIEAAAHHLREGEGTGGYAQTNEFSKDQEAKKLIDWIEESGLWIHQVNESRFIARGAEQRVYLDQDSQFVTKLRFHLL